VDETSRKLATPRTGSQALTRVGGRAVSSEEGLIAAWQSTEAKAPKRCVVRVDGKIVNQLAEDDSAGFPCVVARVDYSIGGLAKTVYIDCQSQSALVLWCESLEVTATWDERRVTRLATFNQLPCRKQMVAAAINSEANVGDTGPADARWLDMLSADETTEDPAAEWSIHPIPEGARGVRFLNALASEANVQTADVATFIIFSACTFNKYPSGLVETAINGFTDQSVIIVPPGARYLFVAFPVGTIGDFDVPAWIEWIMAPNTLFGG
jgi:hypothetical protein